jgi:adenosine deaminase
MKIYQIALIFLNFTFLAGCVSQPSLTTKAPAPVEAAAGLFWEPGNHSAAERFELAKRSTPELIAFLRRMPKGADLHNHLGGATYADFLIESALKNRKRFDLTTNSFTDSRDEAESVDLQTFLQRPDLIAQFRNTLSIRGWLAAGGNGHDHFFNTFPHIGTAGRAPAAMLAEVLNRNAYQNVQHLELMANTVAPETVATFTAAFQGLDLNDLEGSFAPLAPLIEDTEVLASFTAALDAWEQQTDELLQSQFNMRFADAPRVRYIPQLSRVDSLEKFFISAVIFMTGIQADTRIVALNMVAPEDQPSARMQFDAQMKILDFLWNRIGRPLITLHAGELSLRESPVEPMWNRIRRSIDEGHARRIGHGVSIAWEHDLVGLLGNMADEQILVEVIPSSAEVILGVAGRDHPLTLYRAAGVPVCIATDDEAVNRSNLTMEYVKAVQRYDFDYATMKEMVRDCLSGSFLPKHEKTASQQQLEAAFLEFETALETGYREE